MDVHFDNYNLADSCTLGNKKLPCLAFDCILFAKVVTCTVSSAVVMGVTSLYFRLIHQEDQQRYKGSSSTRTPVFSKEGKTSVI